MDDQNGDEVASIPVLSSGRRPPECSPPELLRERGLRRTVPTRDPDIYRLAFSASLSR